ncbi:hypothetical protein PAXRUDRAFT_826925 [Paxillus rubicundulus Ve08.2h10]|uniref:RING-type E3 ubiquitin transferase n=1 Tax=Paxillus rubicundulus Ve08.2h10 TaxID=930991 RepID=A0A0D0DDU4_9AGAM|nr:hypothetical protein PAXRUDRAFT_826925 [Paxillus rubicundulus Ve08.2h10]
MPVCSRPPCNGRSFVNEAALRQHEKSKNHNKIRKTTVKEDVSPKIKAAKNKFKCDFCGSAFQTLAKSKTHQQVMHHKKPQCSICVPPQNFEDFQLLQTHNNSQHTLVPTIFGPGTSLPPCPTLVATEQMPLAPSPSPGNLAMDEASSSQLLDTSLGPQPQTFDSQYPSLCLTDTPHASDDTSVKPMLSSVCDANVDGVRDGSYDMLVVDDVKQGITEGFRATRYCFWCSQHFNTDDDFRGHRDVCPSQRILQPKCTSCYAQFDDELSLQRHVDDSQMTFSCRLCNILCCSDGMLEEHIQDHHPTCRRCGNHFIDDQDLCKHVELEHPTMACWDCGGALVEKYGLEHHYTDSPDHPDCAFCGVGMRDLDAMVEHVHAHHAAEPLVVPSDQLFTGDNPIEPGDELSQQLSPEHECDKPTSSSHDEDECLTSFASSSLVHGGDEGRSWPTGDPPLSAPTESFGDTRVQISHLPSEQPIVNVAATVLAPDSSPVRLPSPLHLEPQELAQHLSNDATPSMGIAEPSVTIAHRLHCRICQRDPCDDMTATICGHIFCKKCITQAVITKPECPVCKSATLIYCLFKFDLTA